MKMPSTTCQNFTTATAKDELNGLFRPKTQARNVRTEVIFDDGGIMEIYHICRQAIETKTGRGDMLD
jgi:hypothetical protein